MEKHMAINNDEYKIGEFFIENGIIDQSQLDDALALQKDNPDRRVGEILVTLGALTKEDLVMAIEMYMMMTDADDIGIDEWLDQEEVDLMLKKLDTP
jgi:Ca2+-binding EF-hand superfamily protein